MKQHYWTIIFAAMLLICVGFGIATRASFTDFSFDQPQVQNCYYEFSLETQGIKNIDYNALSAKSSLILTCRPNDARILKNRCYLTDVRVSKVFKGDKNLVGKTIKVYEPIRTYTFVLDDKRQFDDYAALNKIFGWNNQNRFVFSEPVGTDNCPSYILMSKGRDYLLFLNRSKTRPELPSSQNYTLLDSAYAKLTISSLNAAAYKKPPKYLTLKESMQYEITLDDDKSIKTYFDTKLKILKHLGLL